MSYSSSSDVYRVKSDVRFRVIAGEAVVVLQELAQVLVLNASGAKVLELFDGKRRLVEVAAALREEFEVAGADANRDLAGFVEELRAASVIEREVG